MKQIKQNNCYLCFFVCLLWSPSGIESIKELSQAA